jgi:hypothetical protein
VIRGWFRFDGGAQLIAVSWDRDHAAWVNLVGEPVPKGALLKKLGRRLAAHPQDRRPSPAPTKVEAARSLAAGHGGKRRRVAGGAKGARQGRTRRSRATRRDRARPPAALRFRRVAGGPRSRGRTRPWARPKGKAFPSPFYLVFQHHEHAQQHNAHRQGSPVEPYGLGAPQARAPAQSAGGLDHPLSRRPAPA